ncbi:hypothetical protein B0H17DRAFT_1165387 [Mycena rosella]|uniref:Heparinase II/III family protein n=1 Tax=Mycena rosella TaxID=1033263 RepID=A0AAD7MCE8_MYCRO|nr:hypothetical protein B0H17DRAFT_1165387 [Mycena rosella]
MSASYENLNIQNHNSYSTSHYRCIIMIQATGLRAESEQFGIPILVLVIAAAVLGDVLASHKKSSSVTASGSATEQTFSSPTFVTSTDSKISWLADSFQPSSPDVLSMRRDRLRLIAPAYKWAALPTLIANDPYLQGWNATIFKNVTDYKAAPPGVYFMDVINASGILDNTRQIKQRIKVDRTWEENAAGNGTTVFGPEEDRWNTAHFLDTAELSAAYAIAYNWLYDIQMISTLLKYGLQPGVTQFNTDAGWWRNNITGNWNCVCNSGLTMASFAIFGDDTSGVVQQLFQLTADNAWDNCVQAVSTNGLWGETTNYWYLGTTGHAEMAVSLLSATGSHYGLLDNNTNFFKTGDFHMYITCATSLFNYMFWDGKPLDHFFDNFVNQFHQTHNDLDVGDFVLDALGTRWAGKLGSADYLAADYFTSGVQDAGRWKYYRKMTEGQNTILINQLTRTSFFVTFSDEITASQGVMWRMHTHATIVADGTSVTLTLDGQTMKVTILNPPDGAAFSTSAAERFDSDPEPLEADQENPGVTVLIINLPSGTYNLQVLFNPQWPGEVNYPTPPSVPLDQWTLRSHDST